MGASSIPAVPLNMRSYRTVRNVLTLFSNVSSIM